MWGRFALLLAALWLVLSATPGYAGNTYKMVGRTSFGSAVSSLAGEAFIRQLANGRSHVMLRLTGLTPGTTPTWRVLTGDVCTATPGTVVISRTLSAPVGTSGMALIVLPEVAGIPAPTSTPNLIAIRIDASPQGPELACGRVVDLPHTVLGSAHWW
jgi:hypothetical protein